MQYVKWIAAWLLAMVLAACGGGGGSAGTPTGSGSVPVPDTSAPKVLLGLVDAGVAVNRVNPNGTTVARATVYDKTGATVAGLKVTFTADAGLVVMTPASGVVLTDANGVAEVAVKRASVSVEGAGTLTATAEVAGVTATKSFDYTVGNAVTPDTATPKLLLGMLDGGVAVNRVNTNGTTVIRATVYDKTGVPVSGLKVTFSAAAGLVTMTPSTGVVLTDVNGVAEVPVKRASNSAEGAGTLTASAVVDGVSLTKSFDYTVGSAISTTPTPKVAVQVYNNGVASNRVTLGSTSVARATVKDRLGLPVVGKIVTFTTTDTSLLVFSPASGRVLTNDSGVAEVGLSVASLSANGAGAITASAEVDGATEISKFDFQVTSANVSLSNLSLGSGSLALYGNRPVSVTALINGVPTSTTPVQVTFSASCGTIAPGVALTNGNGVANTTYTAGQLSCGGTAVTITASAVGAAPVSGTLSIGAAQITNLQFVQALPQVIYLAGSVGANQSMVSFKVLDSSGAPLQNQAVELSLVNQAPGVTINTIGNTAPVTLTSDSAGLVTVPVYSGTVPTSAQVRAKLVSNPNLTALSNVLTIAVGRPVQRSLSLAAEKLSLEAGFQGRASVDGLTSTITLSMADRQGNPVPNGTEVNFVTSYGILTPATCITTDSRCTVTHRTQGTRPVNGRVAILAYTPGEEDFVDANGNNVYDLGETFVDMGNAYRDDDFDDVFLSTGEFRVPRAGSSTCAGAFKGVPNTCDGRWGVVDIRDQMRLIWSDGVAIFTVLSKSTAAISVRVNDFNDNSLPTGSAVSAVGSGPDGTKCTVSNTNYTAIPNTTDPVTINLTLKDCFNSDWVDLSVTSVLGIKTTHRMFFP